MPKIGKYGVLNVVLHPHPEGAYRRLFELAAAEVRSVQYYGDRFARISPISETRNGVFTGRLATWSEIDPNSNLIEKQTLNEMLLSESNITIPEGIGFNARVFSFGFRVRDHRLFVEIRNDENQNISIKQARMAFLRIFELARDREMDELDVFVVSGANAITLVLETPGLRQIEIQVDLPNPDVLTGVKANVMSFLQEQHAKKIQVGLTKKAGSQKLILSEGLRELAEVANENGYTRAVGRDDQGNSVHRSTRDYPLEIETQLENTESRAAATRRIAEISGNE